MQKGFYRFYQKEKWINRNIEIEDSLYSELKRLSENELDASINKLVDACVENFKIENDSITYYKKPKNEITEDEKRKMKILYGGVLEVLVNETLEEYKKIKKEEMNNEAVNAIQKKK